MKIVKKLIIIIIILIVFLIIFLVSLKKNQKEVDNITGDEGQQIDYSSEEKEVTDSKSFYTVKKCVNQYLDTINKQNTSYYGEDDNGNYSLILEEKEIKQKVYELLSDEYKEKNNIKLEDVYEFVDDLQEKVFFIPLKMKMINKYKVDKYIVYGIEQNMENEFIKEIYVIINLDKENQTFSIEPLKEYNNIDEIHIQNNELSIEKKDGNLYKYENTTYEYIIREYIDAYKKLALGNPEIAYNLLEEEYREKRFGNVENYKEYIQNNKSEIISLQPTKYITNQYKNNIEYVVQDKYENIYIFNEKSVMNFTIQLDTYTILTEKFMETYQKSNETKKVMMNINKWIQMLNNRDYTAAYNVLDETYRNNTFGSEKEFENRMQENLPLHYTAKYSEFSKENETCIQKVILSDIVGKEQQNIQISVLMQLKEDYGFVMSFSFLEEDIEEETYEEVDEEIEK